MLTIYGNQKARFCDGLSRRNFLKIGGLAMGGLALPQILQAEAQMGITEQGYEVGRENYFKSIALAGALPGELENPATQAGDVALGGAKAQEQGAEAITQANNAWVGPVAGMLGAVGGAAIGRIKPGGSAPLAQQMPYNPGPTEGQG